MTDTTYTALLLKEAWTFGLCSSDSPNVAAPMFDPHKIYYFMEDQTHIWQNIEESEQHSLWYVTINKE